MGILNMWREARGNVMRQEYEDVLKRMANGNQYARSAFYNNIRATAKEMVEHYAAASTSERKAYLKEVRKQADWMWSHDEWPEALGVAISALNAESRFVPGDDAAYVKRETDRLIAEANEPRN